MDRRFQKITPFLWFDHQAEEAALFYVSIFDNSRIVKTVEYTEEGAEASGRPKGTVMTVLFQLGGQDFVALNGGPYFKFNEAVSFVVNCDSQEEVDYFWNRLSEGGDPKSQQCGWLKDRYGVSWQVIPSVLDELLSDSDSDTARRVMKAMLQMTKIDVEDLLTAARGQGPINAGRA